MQRALQLKAMVSETTVTDVETSKVAGDKCPCLLPSGLRWADSTSHFLGQSGAGRRGVEPCGLEGGRVDGGPGIRRSEEDAAVTYMKTCSAHTPPGPSLQEQMVWVISQRGDFPDLC